MASIAAATQSDQFAMQIMRGIENEIEKRSQEIFDKHMQKMEDELTKVKKEVVANAALRIAKHSSIMYMQDRIIIEVLDSRKEK